ncbi:MAG TPA: aminotransferase class III-fold pyridoxal phosphate-dependent enzyme [Deltaproteobacteria bacterium]|nr:aminotransferase class III-fold pyridoxal phosphate-dependent enzyme [Deltaproteobacteria bacterium]
MKRFERSEALWERAVKVIPCGTQTLSKGPDQFVRGVTPKYLERGRGSHVWDADGNEYIDYPLALGPILLGYDYPPVVEAVVRQVREGTTFTLMHPLEVEVAELVCEMVPCAEMVRFAKNGADVTSAAVRVARAATGRDHVVFCGYHGCQDWYAVTTPRNKGIPAVLGGLVHPFEYNDIGSLERVLDEYDGRTACVIMEVPGIEPAVDEASGRNFIQQASELARKRGALFILDEIVTGFRYAKGGAQEYFDVDADLCCLGKGMANGFAVSALAGKREFMRELEEVFFSMTYSGETTGLAAAKATLTEILERPVIEHIWRLGGMLHDGLGRQAADCGVTLDILGKPPRAGYAFRDAGGEEDLLQKSLFLQETVKRGILFGGPIFISYSHDEEDIGKTLEATAAAMAAVGEGLAKGDLAARLEGEPVGVVFRQRS